MILLEDAVGGENKENKKTQKQMDTIVNYCVYSRGDCISSE